jgi:hypothetical protein
VVRDRHALLDQPTRQLNVTALREGPAINRDPLTKHVKDWWLLCAQPANPTHGVNTRDQFLDRFNLEIAKSCVGRSSTK